MHKNKQKIWEWKYSLFFLLLKKKANGWIYTSNILIISIAKERK